MPVFETHFKILNSCLLYIQHVVTTLYGPWKLKNLTFLTVKETLHTNLLRTMIISRVNKNYYYTVTLFLGHVLPFVSCSFVFPLLHWSIPGFKIRMYFFKTKNSGRILKAFCVLWTSVTFSSTRMYFAWRSHSLIHFFVLFFSITIQKEKICVKKNKQYSVKLRDFFFSYFISDGHKIFKRLNIYQSGITMNISNT